MLDTSEKFGWVGNSEILGGPQVGEDREYGWFFLPVMNLFFFTYLFNYCIFTIYSRYLKRVISKRNRCEYLK
jgi:hypothetical protein